MAPDPRDWLLIGRMCWPAPPLVRAGVTGPLQLLRTLSPRRVLRQRWIRYAIDLTDTPPAPAGVHLVPATEALIETLRTRPERAEKELKAGLRLWDGGLRNAYAWVDESGPLAIGWILTADDNGRVRRLREGAGMYRPLAPDWGEIAHLFVFAAARLPDIVARFQRALFDELRQGDLRGLTTHILEGHRLARAILEDGGWRRDGVLTRYLVGWPPNWAVNLYLYRGEVRRAAEAAAVDDFMRSRIERPWRARRSSAAAEG